MGVFTSPDHCSMDPAAILPLLQQIPTPQLVSWDGPMVPLITYILHTLSVSLS